MSQHSSTQYKFYVIFLNNWKCEFILFKFEVSERIYKKSVWRIRSVKKGNTQGVNNALCTKSM